MGLDSRFQDENGLLTWCNPRRTGDSVSWYCNEEIACCITRRCVNQSIQHKCTGDYELYQAFQQSCSCWRSFTLSTLTFCTCIFSLCWTSSSFYTPLDTAWPQVGIIDEELIKWLEYLWAQCHCASCSLKHATVFKHWPIRIWHSLFQWEPHFLEDWTQQLYTTLFL